MAKIVFGGLLAIAGVASFVFGVLGSTQVIEMPIILPIWLMIGGVAAAIGGVFILWGGIV